MFAASILVYMVDDSDVVCVRCTRRRDANASPIEALTWSVEHVRDGQLWLCPGCARTHVRDIEGKLPVDYW
jgi:hypothetical protein